jgi:hypothetical protein
MTDSGRFSKQIIFPRSHHDHWVHQEFVVFCLTKTNALKLSKSPRCDEGIAGPKYFCSIDGFPGFGVAGKH